MFFSRGLMQVPYAINSPLDDCTPPRPSQIPQHSPLALPLALNKMTSLHTITTFPSMLCLLIRAYYHPLCWHLCRHKAKAFVPSNMSERRPQQWRWPAQWERSPSLLIQSASDKPDFTYEQCLDCLCQHGQYWLWPPAFRVVITNPVTAQFTAPRPSKRQPAWMNDSLPLWSCDHCKNAFAALCCDASWKGHTCFRRNYGHLCPHCTASVQTWHAWFYNT